MEQQPNNSLRICIGGTSYEEIKDYDIIAFWIEGIFVLIICLIGILANAVSIPILLSDKLCNVFNRTLACLAIFDNLFLLMAALESIRLYLRQAYTTLHLIMFPQVLYPLQNIAMVASIYTTVVVALERYLAVSKPLTAFINDGDRQWKPVLGYIVPVLMFAVIFNLPTFFEFYVTFGNSTQSNIENDEETYEVDLAVSNFRSNETYIVWYINLARNLVTGIFPLLSLGLINYQVYRNLIKRRNNISRMFDSMDCQTLNYQMRVENRQAHTMFGVVFLFCLGHVFRIFLNLDELLSKISRSSNEDKAIPDDNDCASDYPYWILVSKSVSSLLMTIAFSGNLVIYCTASELFRKVMWQKCICLFVSRDTSTMRPQPSMTIMTSVRRSAHPASQSSFKQPQSIPMVELAAAPKPKQGSIKL